jgi:hypothetical protein
MWSQQCTKLLLSLSYGALCLALMSVLHLLVFTSISSYLFSSRVDRAWLDIRSSESALQLS